MCYRREFRIPILVKLTCPYTMIGDSGHVELITGTPSSTVLRFPTAETPNRTRCVTHTFKLENYECSIVVNAGESVPNRPIALRCYPVENENERSAGVEKNRTSTVQQFRRFLQRDIRIATDTRLIYSFFFPCARLFCILAP